MGLPKVDLNENSIPDYVENIVENIEANGYIGNILENYIIYDKGWKYMYDL